MNTIRDWGEAFLTAISNAFTKLFSFLPDLIGALLILWIGWLVAGWLAKLTADVLRRLKFNQATEKAGMNRFLGSAGIKQDAAGVMGEIVKWFFRLIALVAAFSVLQLPALTAALTGILNFIPNLFIAVVILLVGGLIANFVSNFVRGAAGSAGFSNAGLVANAARYAILYVAVIAAIGQLGVAETVINTLFIGTVAALAIALGLAFGLGGRDTAAQIWQNTYNSAQQNLPRLRSGFQMQSEQTKWQAQQAMDNAAATVHQAQTAAPNNVNTQGGYSTHYNTGYAAQPSAAPAPTPPGGNYAPPQNPLGKHQPPVAGDSAYGQSANYRQPGSGYNYPDQGQNGAQG